MNDGRLLSLFVWRYAFSRGNRHRKANIAILLGIMVGMAALITILSLMNSLQDDLIEQVRSVESFHIQAVFDSDEVALKGYDAIIEALEAIEHVSYARPFIDIQALVQNKSSR
ncbi:MAG: ABC transporter permease, partial [Sphaerochaetaceae bacterium]